MSQAQVLTAPSVSLFNGRPATTSLAVAECFGKRHDNVMRSIKDLVDNCPKEFTALNFEASEYTDETGRTLSMFIIYFDGFMLLVMGYTGKKALEMKLAYIGAFRAMKEKLDKLAKEERARLSGDVKQIPEADRPSRRTDPERKQLTAILNTWVGLAPIHYASARAQVNAHFGVTGVDGLTVAQVREAIQWVQGKIDALPVATPAPGLPEASAPAYAPVPAERPLIYRDGKYYPMRRNQKHVVGPREKAIVDFWSFEYPRREAEIEERFKKLLEGIDAAIGDTIHQSVAAIGRDADTMFSISCLLEGLHSAKDGARESFKEALRLARLHMRMATSMATAMNR